MWEREERGEEMPLEEEVQWIRGVMQDACNTSMPRIRLSPRKAAYWWTEEIAELWRSTCMKLAPHFSNFKILKHDCYVMGL